jgi:hypothetical protein
MSIETPQGFAIDVMWTEAAVPAAAVDLPVETVLLAEQASSKVSAALNDADIEIASIENRSEAATRGQRGGWRSQFDVEATQADYDNLDALPYRRDAVYAARERLGGRRATAAILLTATLFGVGLAAGMQQAITRGGDSGASAPALTPEPQPSVERTLPPNTDSVTYSWGPEGTVIVTSKVAGGTSAAAVNPLARDCKRLTGTELDADKRVVQEGVDAAKGLGGTIVKAVVEGVADDAAGSNADADLGKPNEGNDCRGNARKDVGVQALSDVATANGHPPIANIVATGGERILKEHEIKKFDEIAAGLGLTRQQLVAQYNNNRTDLVQQVDSANMAILDDYLFRGVKYEFTIEGTKTEQKPADEVVGPTNIVEDATRNIKEGTPTGWAILGGAGTVLTGVGYFLGQMAGGAKLVGFFAARRARREVAAAQAKAGVTTSGK